MMSSDDSEQNMPPANRNSDYKAVRGLLRGLDILRALNRMPEGRATSAELSDATGIHRTTVRRMLETLIHDGCVRRSGSDDRFCLTLRVRELSEGFTDAAWISTVAAPVMGELLQRVVWPSDLSTPNGDAMQVRETTHRFSSLSFHRSMVGRRLPMLSTASGRAYIAFCSDEEREQTLQILRASEGEQKRLASDDRFVANLIQRVRGDGFASNAGEWSSEKKIGAIALPILSDTHILGTLNVVYLTSAITVNEAVKRYLAPLRAAVQKIANELRAEDH